MSNLLEIDNVPVPKMKGYKVQRNKLWANADRNMAGELRATFVGIFPKIVVEFAPLTKTEMQRVITLLDKPSFSLEWFDEYNNAVQTGTFYAGDYEYSLYNSITNLYEGFSVSLIPFEKYTATPSA